MTVSTLRLRAARPGLLTNLLLGLALLLGGLLPSAASAQQATAYIRGQHERANALLRQSPSNDRARQARREQLSALVRDLLDYETLSQRALGDHWGERTPEERQRFVDLLRQLVERNYESNLERTLEFDIRYGDEESAGGDRVVHTEARSRTERRQPPIEIEYTVRRDGSRWRVVDVTTDGVSLVSNYRRQFHRIITRDGWNELIQRMERRLNGQGSGEGD